jgi:hypothetical protein
MLLRRRFSSGAVFVVAALQRGIEIDKLFPLCYSKINMERYPGIRRAGTEKKGVFLYESNSYPKC